MTATQRLEQVKSLLGITAEESASDTMLDTNLTWIISAAEARLKNLLGGEDPPEELEHIIIEVAVIRYNRIGSEGLLSHSVKDETMSFSDNDFSGFMGEIEAWLDEQDGTKRGRVRFI